MKILSPIDKIEEALPLIKAGADEFYCGILIGNKNFSTMRSSSLKKSNLSGFGTLRKLVKLVKKKEKKIFLALNDSFINPRQSEVIERNLDKIKESGIDGIIIGNIDLMNRLKKSGLEIIASSLLETKNEETVRFLNEKFKVKRIILDRQITLDDIKNITSRFPKMEFESFIIEGGCRSLISACRRHLVTRKEYLDKKLSWFPHLCWFDFSIENKKIPFFSSKDKKVIAGRLTMPYKCCGACALFQFQKYGITSVKIVGRGFSTVRKVKNIKFIRDALNILERSYREEDFYRKTEKLFEKTFHKKCQRQYCYYPHFFNG